MRLNPSYKLLGIWDSNPSKRIYFVAIDENEEVIGGVGIAEFEGIENCAELQKLYFLIL